MGCAIVPSADEFGPPGRRCFAHGGRHRKKDGETKTRKSYTKSKSKLPPQMAAVNALKDEDIGFAEKLSRIEAKSPNVNYPLWWMGV